MTAQTDLPTGEDLLAAIDRLRKEKNAIILAITTRPPISRTLRTSSATVLS